MTPATASALSPGARIYTAGDDGRVAEAITAHGAEPTSTLADAAVAVAVGREAIVSVALADSAVPILPIDPGPDFGAVEPAAVEDTLDRLFAADWPTSSHPIVTVATAGERRRAVLDVAVVVADPGLISEFGVHSRGQLMGATRADGIVAALPAGSGDYARAVGGPVLAPETGVAAVSPIAPYAVDPDHWVLPLTDLQLSIERAETPVALVVDGTAVDRVGPDEPVTIDRTGRFHAVAIRGGLETP